jgi:hypothetical protein
MAFLSTPLRPVEKGKFHMLGLGILQGLVYNTYYMVATLVIHTKEIKEDEMVEIKVWQVPRTKTMPDGVKISVVYIRNGKRLLGYDNAEGKGYHRHFMGKEEPYRFSHVRALLGDFKKDIRSIRGRDWDESQEDTH